MKKIFGEKDLKQLKEKGISPEKAEEQIKQLTKGFPYADIIAPATVGKGIFKPEKNLMKKYLNLYEKESRRRKTVKFVPASGAASRMFKNLFAVLNGEANIDDDKSFNSAYNFFQNIEKFAFFNDLKNICDKKTNLKKDYKKTLECLLTEKGLNYGNLPKGLLKFHKYENEERTPAEEHLAEGGQYAKTEKGVFTHFTVSPEHLDLFQKLIKNKTKKYEKLFNTRYFTEFSIQKTSTDTIAVDLNNNIFRNPDGSILFRPGGHGALTENLNDIDADLIFVKNIDNVVPEKFRDDTVLYKKLIAGILIETENTIFNYIKMLKKSASKKNINEVKNFFEKKLFITFDNSFEKKSDKEKAVYLIKKLNRPIRVCGMVKNEGEPGGGPFFVRSKSGSVSLQIVESSQIDLKNPEKYETVKNATHFNPVDLVLSVKDYEGNKFDLTKFVDKNTGFISVKSKYGKELKALELPGLWNGAMAFWNTIFVEVPVSTFNPVKTVNDLLREAHL